MKNRLIAIAVAVLPAVVLIAAGWVMWIGPRGAERSAAEAEQMQTSDELRAAQVQLGKAREFASHGGTAVAHLTALRQLLPTEPDVGGFVTLNADAARASGVEILSVVPEQPDSEANSSFALDDSSSSGSDSGSGSSSTDSSLGNEVSATESTSSSDSGSAPVNLPDGVEAVNVSITVRGSDVQIPAYLASISGLSRLVLINEVSTVAEGDGNTSATLRVSVLFRSS